MTERSEIFLGVIALATLAAALAQVGVAIVTGMAVRRVSRLAAEVEREMKPFFTHMNAIGREASRATALATAQVERADALFSDLAVRIDSALNGLQSSIEAPAREGRAILSGFRAAIQALREIRYSGRSRQGRGDDEDALFI